MMTFMNQPNPINTSEEWRDIPGWEGSYQVSSWGQVRTMERTIIIGNYATPFTRESHLMKLQLQRNGYVAVWLRRPLTHKRQYVHRLVALAFLPCEKPDELVVNHKDRNRTNNDLSNLEWSTYSDNSHHYVKDDKVRAGNAEVPF